jgi:hypothetical protein
MFGTFRYILTGFVLVVYLLANMSCAFSGDKVYWGKVIDADTKEPVEGAVVVAVWQEARATISGESTRLKDVKETLTDKNGKWSITGPKGQGGSNPILLLTFLTGMHYTRVPEFIIFKPGYCSWPKGFSIGACKEKIRHSGTAEITEGGNVELPKLGEKEDRRKALIGPVDPYDEKRYEEILKKQKEFIRLLNQERKYLGLQEY